MSEMSETEQSGAVTTTLLDRLLEGSSRTFALTIPLLPEPTRCEVTLAYLLFRVADTLEDSTVWSRERKLEELDGLARFLDSPSIEGASELSLAWREDPPCDHDGYRELLDHFPDVVREYLRLDARSRDLITTHTLRTVAGMSSYVAREVDGALRLEDLPDLEDYCYAVAGIVGELLTELFLVRGDGLDSVAEDLRSDAAKFGEALQLVNILKDSAGDSAEGRHFLPAGVDRAAVFAQARADLETAGRYCVRLESAGAARGLVAFTSLPVLLAWATLQRVETGGPGSKLTRAEVVRLIADLESALDERRISTLWDAMSGDRT